MIYKFFEIINSYLMSKYNFCPLNDLNQNTILNEIKALFKAEFFKEYDIVSNSTIYDIDNGNFVWGIKDLNTDIIIYNPEQIEIILQKYLIHDNRFI